MYILDTNVISELRKAGDGRANGAVTAWASSVAPSTLFLSAITVLELERGTLMIERRDQAQGALLRTWVDPGSSGFRGPGLAGRHCGRAAMCKTACSKSPIGTRCLDRRDGARTWHDSCHARRCRFRGDQGSDHQSLDALSFPLGLWAADVGSAHPLLRFQSTTVPFHCPAFGRA